MLMEIDRIKYIFIIIILIYTNIYIYYILTKEYINWNIYNLYWKNMNLSIFLSP